MPIPKLVDFKLPTGNLVEIETTFGTSVIKEDGRMVDLCDPPDIAVTLGRRYGKGAISQFKLASTSIRILEGDSDDEDTELLPGNSARRAGASSAGD